MQTLAAIIPAAGHGALLGRCKLLALVGGKSMLQHVIETVRTAGSFSPLVIVVNSRYGDEIRNATKSWGYSDIEFVHQPERRGAAEAVNRAIPLLESRGIQDMLVVLGEMLFMNPQTMSALVYHHFKKEADLSLLTWPYDRYHPLAACMDNYAFIVRGGGTPLLFMYKGYPIDNSDVIGSLYAFRVPWFKAQFPEIRPLDKKDGFGPEYHLPSFVERAVLASATVVNMQPSHPREVLGVNTPADLEFANSLFSGKP